MGRTKHKVHSKCPDPCLSKEFYEKRVMSWQMSAFSMSFCHSDIAKLERRKKKSIMGSFLRSHSNLHTFLKEQCDHMPWCGAEFFLRFATQHKILSLFLLFSLFSVFLFPIYFCSINILFSFPFSFFPSWLPS